MTDITFAKSTITISGKTLKAAYTINGDGSITATAQINEKKIAIQINPDHPLHAAALAAASADTDPSAETSKGQNHFGPDKQAHGPVPKKTWIGTSILGSGWRIEFCPIFERTRLIFNRAPTKEAREMVKAAGFVWSTTMGSWNKKLTWKAYRAAQKLAADLEGLQRRAC